MDAGQRDAFFSVSSVHRRAVGGINVLGLVKGKVVADFDYLTAFSRNIGWVTREEQARLRNARVAIAGLGGVGGSHALTLARLGVGAFAAADPDTFGLENFNRQAGASMASIGYGKLAVIREQLGSINPEVQVDGIEGAVAEDNVDEFLAGADLYVDGLDFFALEARRLVFAACAERGIPAITAAPLGMGVAFLAFLPGHMTFEEYFRMEGQSREEQLLRFLVGLSPAMLQTSYLVEPSTVRLKDQKGPSTAMGCELCAGVAATEALKILLGRGPVRAAPKGLHFDAYLQRYAKTWRPGGNRNPVQRFALAIARRRFRSA
ncbi:MAG: ThiF family adenylyltransferase [Spiribacter salinus]|uniref:ThiF family adenylyltransferase n=1 Tax=Spiribacter salinus TaxID=1335746 RepID=A0A540VQ41_9GAMM|nr:MAG: ThiF family adenylyltransferase [Spiribacter salinus]